MKLSIKKFIHEYRWAALSGVLVGTSYIPFPPWALYFCLVPLWKTWTNESSAKKIFISGWVTQFILSAIGFHWIAHTTVEYGHLPWPVAIITLILYSTHANLHIPIAGILWHRFFKNKSSPTAILGLAFMTILFESVFPQIFSWNLGYPLLWAKLPAFQLADLIGFQGLSAITLLVNALFLIAYLTSKASRLSQLLPNYQSRKNSEAHRKYLKITAGLIALNLLGYLWGLRLADPDGSVKISIIQGNIGNFEKFASEREVDFRAPIVQKYFELTRRSLQESPETELFIWPETAFPSNLEASALERYYPSQLRTFISSIEKPFFIGGYTELPNNGPYFNSLFYFDKTGSIKDRYDKSHLLAFGEYFPGSDYFPALKKLIPEISDFGRGKGPSVIPFMNLQNEVINFGAQICYEGLFPFFSKGLSNKNAQIFVNITNDSWFGHTFESYQHLYMTLARAIEFRRSLIRSTNTGISAAIDYKGNVLIRSPQESEWFKMIDVPYQKNPSETFYAQFGIYLVYVFAVVGLLVAYQTSKKR